MKSVGVLHGPFKVMPPTWSSKVDDSVRFLQWSHTCLEVHDRCDSRRNIDEQAEDEAYNLMV